MVVIEDIAGYTLQGLANAVGILCGVLTVGVAGTANGIFRRTIAVDEPDIAIAGDDFLTGRLSSNKNGLERRRRILVAGMQECRWDASPGDLFLLHQLEQTLRILLHGFWGCYQRGTCEQGTEDINDRSVKDIGRELNDAVVCRGTIDAWCTCRHHRNHATMGYDNTFGHTCSARRIDHIGRRRYRYLRLWLDGSSGLKHVFKKTYTDRGYKSLDVLQETSCRHQALHATIGYDMTQAFLGIGVVERHVETAGSDNTQDGGQRLGRTLTIDTHSTLGKSVGHQHSCYPHRCVVELLIGITAILVF